MDTAGILEIPLSDRSTVTRKWIDERIFWLIAREWADQKSTINNQRKEGTDDLRAPKAVSN